MLQSLIIPQDAIIFKQLKKIVKVPLPEIFDFKLQYSRGYNFLLKLLSVEKLLIRIVICLQVKLKVGYDLLIVHILIERCMVKIIVTFHEELREVLNGILVLEGRS